MSASDDSIVEIDPEQLRLEKCISELQEASEENRDSVLDRYYGDNPNLRALADFLGLPLALAGDGGPVNFPVGSERGKTCLLPHDPQQYDAIVTILNTDQVDGTPYLSPKRITYCGRLIRWVKRNQGLAAGLAGMAILVMLSLTWFWSRPAYLTLRIEPTTARVTLNDQPLWTVSGKLAQAVAPGARRLTVTAAGYEPYEEMLSLVRGSQATTIREVRLIPLVGRLEISTNPTDADIELVDAAGITIASGKSTFRTSELPSGKVTLRITKPLYSDVTQTVLVPKDRAMIVVNPVTLAAAFPREFGSPELADKILHLDDRFTTVVRSDQETLDQIAQRISKESLSTVIIDWEAIEKIGYQRESTWSLIARSLGELISELRRVGLALTLGAEHGHPWTITSIEVAEGARIKGLYSLKSLRLKVDAEHATRLIYSHVQPRMWNPLGGPGSITPISAQEALSVSATLAIHAEVAAYLKSISQESGPNEGAFQISDLTWSDDFAFGQTQIVDHSFGLVIDNTPVMLMGHDSTGHGLLFLDNRRLVSASEDTTLRLWDCDTAEPLLRYKSGRRRIICLAALPNSEGTRFVSGDGDGNVKLYYSEQAEPLVTNHRHQGDVTSLAIDGSGEWLLSGGSDGYIVRFKMPELKYDSYGRTHCHHLGLVNYDANRTILSALGEEEVWAMDSESLFTAESVATQDVIPQLVVVDDPENPSRQGRLILAGQRLSSWRLGESQFQLLKTLDELPSVTQSIARFNKHPLFVTLHRDSRLVIRNSVTLKEVAVIRLGIEQSRAAVAVSPDDSKLAAFNWVMENDRRVPAIFVYRLKWEASMDSP